MLSLMLDPADQSPPDFEDACSAIQHAREFALSVLEHLEQLDHYICYEQHGKTLGYLQDAMDELQEAKDQLAKVDATVTAWWQHAEREPDSDAYDPGY
jgi:hypothetical protein